MLLYVLSRKRVYLGEFSERHNIDLACAKNCAIIKGLDLCGDAKRGEAKANCWKGGQPTLPAEKLPSDQNCRQRRLPLVLSIVQCRLVLLM